MALSSSTFGDIGAAVKDIFGGIGAAAEGNAYTTAATYAEQNAEITAQSTALQETQAQRKIFQTIGAQQAAVGGAGLTESGSNLDLMRSSAEQGALTKQLIGQQGQITETGYEEQAAAYRGMASAAKSSSTGSFLGGAVSAIAALFSFR